MSNQTPEKTPRQESRFKELAMMALKSVLHNWGFKLLALLLAVLLWAGLITQDPTLTRERSFDNVSVSITGTDAIKRNGFIVVSDLRSLLDDVSLHVNVPQMQYQNVTAANYNARIDLSRITTPGTQSLRVLTTNSSTYGTVVEVDPATVEIEVEPYISRYRIPVRTNVVGKMPEGYYASSPILDPPLVTISGPESLVQSVICAEAVVDLSALPGREGAVRQAVSFTLLNRENEPVTSDLLEVTSESVLLDSVVVTQNLYSVQEIPLSDLGLVRGTPAAGYEIKSISITPESVMVAGEKDEMAELDLLYADSYVDVSGCDETINGRVRIRQPSALVYMSASTATVVVEIGPVITSKTFQNVSINLENTPDNLLVERETRTTTVTVSGPQLWMDRLSKNDITLTCDVTGLQAGSYELPVQCSIVNSDGDTCSAELATPMLSVQLVEK